MAQRLTFPGEDALLFAKNFISILKCLVRSSPVRDFSWTGFSAKVDWKRARTLVEYGPGVGTITAHILERMSRDARLIVFEMNGDFVRYLRRALPTRACMWCTAPRKMSAATGAARPRRR